MSKTLVLYFSVYGTTKKVAQEITRQTGADLFEIEPVTPYDNDRSHYDELARFTKREHDENARPALKNVPDFSGYDTIFVGYPMWWFTLPMALYTLFDEVDFSGKTIVPFNTHMGSRDGGTYQTIAELEPHATVLPGLPVEMSAAEQGDGRAIASWLAQIGICAAA